jgi:8-oxo-dGTP pyrophosphatase MutT (NUDIX family)
VRRPIPPAQLEVRQWVPLLEAVARTATAKPGYHGTLAAGVLPVALDTCRALLQQRSAGVREGNTWGIVGGAVDSLAQPGHPSTAEDFAYLNAPGQEAEKDRALRETAAREFREETGRLPAQVLDPFYVFRPPSAPFEYHDFLGTVPAEFKPKPESGAAWEASGYAWVGIPDLLSAAEAGEYKGVPLHSGLRDALQDPAAQQLLKQADAQCQHGTLK